MQFSRNVNGKLLRCGYTTGACATAAAKACAVMLLRGEPIQTVTIDTPKGIPYTADLLEVQIETDHVSCAVQKESGDDPDVTNGALVYATVARCASGVEIDGGLGVGRVTKPGLDQPVGAAAINSTPRRMITEALQAVAVQYGYAGGFSVEISIPAGVELAKRTFNPKLGIVGGISVIGTTGIVEPMSHAAIVDTVRVELRQLRETGAERLLLTPGNYGEVFSASQLNLPQTYNVSCSNYIGDALDCAAELGFTQVLLVGHIGKLAKLGIGMLNTHSHNGDGRMETLLACALDAGADLPLLTDILHCATTDAALAHLHDRGLLQQTLTILGARIEETLSRRVPPQLALGYICFTNAPPLQGILMQSGNAQQLIDLWRTQA